MKLTGWATGARGPTRSARARGRLDATYRRRSLGSCPLPVIATYACDAPSSGLPILRMPTRIAGFGRAALPEGAPGANEGVEPSLARPSYLPARTVARSISLSRYSVANPFTARPHCPKPSRRLVLARERLLLVFALSGSYFRGPGVGRRFLSEAIRGAIRARPYPAFRLASRGLTRVLTSKP